EDGIRVFHVTGVQTCALPISRSGSRVRIPSFALSDPGYPARVSCFWSIRLLPIVNRIFQLKQHPPMDPIPVPMHSSSRLNDQASEIRHCTQSVPINPGPD